MSGRKAPSEVQDLARALRTHQLDAIVGDRYVMFLRSKRADAKMKNSRDRLRALAAGLQAIRENERAAIAREVHDEFGQALTSLQLGLSWMAGKTAPAQQPLRSKIASLAALTTTMIQSVRKIADELRPGVLDELGLIKTLRSEAREFEGHTQVPCKFETNAEKARFDRAGSVAIFRILQAALTNVTRHAHATKVLVSLTKHDRDIVLTVSDNGSGIARKRALSHDSLGIIGMRERALAFGGTLAIHGSKVHGTTLTLRMPQSQVLAPPPPAKPRAATPKADHATERLRTALAAWSGLRSEAPGTWSDSKNTKGRRRRRNGTKR